MRVIEFDLCPFVEWQGRPQAIFGVVASIGRSGADYLDAWQDVALRISGNRRLESLKRQ